MHANVLTDVSMDGDSVATASDIVARAYSAPAAGYGTHILTGRENAACRYAVGEARDARSGAPVVIECSADASHRFTLRGYDGRFVAQYRYCGGHADTMAREGLADWGVWHAERP